MHHLLQEFNEQLAVESPLVSAKPESAIGIDRRGRADGLPLPRTMNNRRLASYTPCLAMHRVSAKSRLIPEEHFSPLCLGLAGNLRVRFTLPFLNGLRVALISPLQWLLRCQSQLGKQFTDCRQPKLDAELLFNQCHDNRTCPQAEVQAILSRVASIDPAEHLALLSRRQRAGPPSRFARTQRFDTDTGLQCRVNPRRAQNPSATLLRENVAWEETTSS
jgi:hypothetical protein